MQKRTRSYQVHDYHEVRRKRPKTHVTALYRDLCDELQVESVPWVKRETPKLTSRHILYDIHAPDRSGTHTYIQSHHYHHLHVFSATSGCWFLSALLYRGVQPPTARSPKEVGCHTAILFNNDFHNIFQVQPQQHLFSDATTMLYPVPGSQKRQHNTDVRRI